MTSRTSRILFALASLLSTFGGALHASAFTRAGLATAASNLPAFYKGSLLGLWLSDSATLFILALLFGLIAARPTSATRPTALLVALIPAVTAAMLYTFLGIFIAEYLLLLIAALAFTGALKLGPTSV